MFTVLHKQSPQRPGAGLEKDVRIRDVSCYGLIRRNMARGLSLMLLIILLGTQGSSCLKLMGARAYQQQTVTQGSFHVSVSAYGWLQSAVYNLALPSITANIQKIYVRLGQKVTKGQILAQLDPITLQQAYYTAQASVNAAKKNLFGALLFERDAIASTNIRIAQAQKLVQAAQAFVYATYKSTDANLVAAQVIVESDQNILNAVRRHFDITLRTAKAQLQDNLNACSSTSTPTSDNPPGSPTASNTPGPGIPGNPSQESQPQDGQAPREGAYTVARCVQSASAIYKQTVAEAHVALTTAEQQVVKDQQLINIARANGGENDTNARLTYEYALDLLVIEQHNFVVTSAIAALETAQGQLEIALAQLEVARQNLGNATLKAPHDGVVTAINGTVGGPPGYVINTAAGSSAPDGIFIQLVDLSSVRQLLTRVKDTDTPTIRSGQPVQFTLKPYPHRQFNGTVSAISPNGLSGKGGDMEHPVVIDFDPNNMVGVVLLPNTTANATITVLDKPNAIRVPVSAIDNNFTQQHRGDPPLISQRQANDALSQAQNMLTQLVKQNPKLISYKPFPSFVVEPTASGSTYIVKPVVLGLSDGTYYEVLRGLSVGESVMVRKVDKMGTPSP